MNKTAVVAALVVAAVLGWHFGAQEKSVSADVAAASDGTKAAGVVELQDQVAATYEGSTDQVHGTQTGAMADRR